MALSLKQLVQIVPIDDNTRKKVLEQEDKLTESQKFAISQTCWGLLSVMISNRRQEKFDAMLKEMSEGGIEYQPADFDRAEDEIIAEFLIKIDQLQTTENIAEVKSQLEKNLPQKPLSNAPTQLPN
jgi:hypothetical protein